MRLFPLCLGIGLCNGVAGGGSSRGASLAAAGRNGRLRSVDQQNKKLSARDCKDVQQPGLAVGRLVCNTKSTSGEPGALLLNHNERIT
jgi:hypothetical protein